MTYQLSEGDSKFRFLKRGPIIKFHDHESNGSVVAVLAYRHKRTDRHTYKTVLLPSRADMGRNNQ